MHQPCRSKVGSCQTDPRSLGSSFHRELHYNSCTVPECISPVYPWWIAVKQVQEVWVVLFHQVADVLVRPEPVFVLRIHVDPRLDPGLQKYPKTRMYSSRMRTVRCSGRRVGCLPQCMLGYMPSGCWDTPRLWTEFLTHACENITFPQLLLWTVTRLSDPRFDPSLENYQITVYICGRWHDENEIRARERVKPE